MRDHRQVREYLSLSHVAILVVNALVRSYLDYCNSLIRILSSFNVHKLQCIQNTLVRIVTNCNSQSSPILKQPIGCHLNFHYIFKTTTLVSKFHSGHPSYFVHFCLFVMEDTEQDTTIQIKVSWGFLNITHLYITKNHFG